jgi:pantoate kinase
MEMFVDNVIKYCEDHAKEIVARRPSESELFWKSECLSRRRGLVREKLLEIIRNADRQLEAYLPSYDQRRQYIRMLYQKVDQYMSRLQA